MQLDNENDRTTQIPLTFKWTGNKGQGTKDYRFYDRSHTVSIDGKQDILCTSDPAFRGDKTKHNPEELFLASISSCHMLWYLHLCADNGIVVVDCSDNTTGTMQETENGSGHFTEVTLHPIVTVADFTWTPGSTLKSPTTLIPDRCVQL